ncbi:MAG: GNAT family N-acyltransferase [Idiomarina sp.]
MHQARPNLSIEEQIFARLPAIARQPWLERPVRKALKSLCHEQDFESFLSTHNHRIGSDFVGDILDFFEFDYLVSPRAIENIPQQGRVVIYANHPIGSLDGIALLHMVRQVRPDVRIVANQLLWGLTQLRPMLLPVTNIGGRAGKLQLQRIHEFLANEGAVIIFPSGEVSRLRPQGVRDTHWQSGFVKIARKTNTPMLPIHVQGRNSWSFYGSSMVHKTLGTLLLIKEMFRQRGGQVRFTVGQAHQPGVANMSSRDAARHLRKQLYSLAKIAKRKATPAAKAPRAIAYAESPLAVRDALAQQELLLEMPNGLQLYLYYAQPDCPVLRELGRVREQVFRAIGEGTSKRCDVDTYDQSFAHLILWHPQHMKIAGGYRLGVATANFQQFGQGGVYTASLFNLRQAFSRYIRNGIELGRSFVCEAYRDRYSLDYLWLGIGVFLRKYPQQRFLFGPVSLSGDFPAPAKDLIVAYYQHFYPASAPLAEANRPFEISAASMQQFQHMLAAAAADSSEVDAQKAFVFRELKAQLKLLNCALPPLFKQYSELCDAGGVQFAAFSVDPDFNNSVDGLVIVDLHKLKPAKRQRYLEQHHNDMAKAS